MNLPARSLLLAVVGLAFTFPLHAQIIPRVTVAASDEAAGEAGRNPGVFVIRRDTATNGPLTVFLNLSGSAQNGVDYDTLPASVTIPAGRFGAELVVRPIDDALVDAAETVVLTLVPSPVALPVPPYVIASPGQARVGIADNDVEQPVVRTVVTVVATDAEGGEIPVVRPGLGMPQAVNPAIFTLRREGSTNEAVEVRYVVSGTAINGLDYQRLPGTATFAPGHRTTTIMVVPVDDLLVEGRESVGVQIEAPACVAIFPPPAGCYLVGVPGRAEAVILDDDREPVNQAPTVTLVAPADRSRFAAPATFEVEARPADADNNLAGVEFYQNGRLIGFVTNDPGMVFIRNPYFVTVTGLPAGEYAFTARAVDLRGAVGWSPSTLVLVTNTTPRPGTNALPVVNIVARDPHASEGLMPFLADAPVWNEGTNRPIPADAVLRPNLATFRIARGDNTNGALTVAFAIGGTARNGIDYSRIDDTAMIPAGRRYVDVTITPLDDDAVEPAETVVLELLPAVDDALNADPARSYAVGRPARASAVITDNDRRPLAMAVLPDRQFHFCQPGTNGAPFAIDVSTNLLHWEVICTNRVADQCIRFVDPDAAHSPRRFYRVRPVDRAGE